jgi:hypothetical protein
MDFNQLFKLCDLILDSPVKRPCRGIEMYFLTLFIILKQVQKHYLFH